MPQFPYNLQFNFDVNPAADGSIFPHTFPSVFGLRKGAADQTVTVTLTAQVGSPVAADAVSVTVSATAEMRFSAALTADTAILAGLSATPGFGVGSSTSVDVSVPAGVSANLAGSADLPVTVGLPAVAGFGVGSVTGVTADWSAGASAALLGSANLSVTAGAFGATALGTAIAAPVLNIDASFGAATSLRTDIDTSVGVVATLSAALSLGQPLTSSTAVTAVPVGVQDRNAVVAAAQNISVAVSALIESDTTVDVVLAVVAAATASLAGTYRAGAVLPVTVTVQVRAQLGGTTIDRIEFVAAEVRTVITEFTGYPYVVAAENRVSTDVVREPIVSVSADDRLMLVGEK